MAVGAGLLIAGTALSAYGSYKAGKQRAAALRHRRVLLNIQANEVERRGEINNKLIARSFKQLQANQKVAIAGSGIDVGSSSALDVLEETALRASEEILRNTRETRFEAASLRHEGALSGMQANQAMAAGKLKAFGTILGGAYEGYSASGSPTIFGSNQGSGVGARNFGRFMNTTDNGSSRMLPQSSIGNFPGSRAT